MDEESKKSTTRKVATEEGSRFYGKPIGSEITSADEKAAEGRKRPVTMLRLKSLQRQFIQAQRSGSEPLKAAINKQFKAEMKIFMDISGKSVKAIFDDLDANMDTGFLDSTEVKDTDSADENKPGQALSPDAGSDGPAE